MIKLSMLNGVLMKHGFLLVVLFHLLLWYLLRPLGVLFLAILTAWLFLTQCNLRILPPPELIIKMEHMKESLLRLQQNQPKKLYISCTSLLLSLVMVGHYLSETTTMILAMLSSSILMAKYPFTIIPGVSVLPLESFQDTEVEDEFIPDVSESSISVLERASGFAPLNSTTEDAVEEEEESKSDEIPSELLLADKLPEIDETDDDEQVEEIDELMPIMPSRHKKDQTFNDDCAKLTTEAERMAFIRGHFKRSSSSLLTTSSSSSDEESLSKGLHFPDHTTVDASQRTSRERELLPSIEASDDDAFNGMMALAVKMQAQALLQSTTRKFLPNLLTSLGHVISGGGARVSDGAAVSVGVAAGTTADKRKVTALDSSDDSDFEILEDGDFH